MAELLDVSPGVVGRILERMSPRSKYYMAVYVGGEKRQPC